MKWEIIKGLVVVLLFFLAAIGPFPSEARSVAYPDINNALTPKEQELIHTIERNQELIRALALKIAPDHVVIVDTPGSPPLIDSHSDNLLRYPLPAGSYHLYHLYDQYYVGGP